MIYKLHPDSSELQALASPPERGITVAHYLCQRLNIHGASALHTISTLEESPVVISGEIHRLIEPKFWSTIREATWTASIDSRYKSLGVIYTPEPHITDVIEGIIVGAHELLSLVFIVQHSLRTGAKALCGLPLSPREQSRRELSKLCSKLSATHVLLDDRRTAADQIDRALDRTERLHQPVVLELPDEIAQSLIPPHTYKKTIFNSEDHDSIALCWETIINRLQQAHAPLLVLGHECYRPEWNRTLLCLSQAFRADVVASPELWGHFGADVPEGFQGYFSLDDDFIGFEETYDSLFLFGVSNDAQWQESLITNPYAHPEKTKEFFSINASTLLFEPSEWMQPPCLDDFFHHIPHMNSSVVGEDFNESLPIWHTIIGKLSTSSPLFAACDRVLLRTIIQTPPCASLLIQPETADASWASTCALHWSQTHRSVIFVAGSSEYLRIAFSTNSSSVPENLVLLVQGSFLEMEEVKEQLGGIFLPSEQEASRWRAIPLRRPPAVVWIGL